MCGIAGWIGEISGADHTAHVLAQKLKHRGPDDQGCKIWTCAGLVHTRLSIIDVSPSGRQPMSNETQSLWTVFNGELYNHRQLRNDLQQRGHRFVGHSDTEVLPHLYEESGAAFVNSIRGMFAFAIYDIPGRKLLLVRDRFGIKPLFYSFDSKRLLFCSEIGALRSLPGLDTRPNLQAIFDYSSLFFVPAPNTFIRSIKALEPGQCLEAQLVGDELRVRTWFYHKWTIAPDLGLTLPHAVREAEERVDRAVASQLESDVPLGVLLSGGIDSSLVSATAARFLNGNRVKTFNVRFPQDGYDETAAALRVSSHLNTNHRTLEIASYRGDWEGITSLLRSVGQPFADSSIFPAHALCRLTKTHVTVALSGDGGDEAFGGYNRFWQMELLKRFGDLPGVVRAPMAWLWESCGKNGAAGSQRDAVLQEAVAKDPCHLVQAMVSWIRTKELSELWVGGKVEPTRRLFDPVWPIDVPGRSWGKEYLSALLTEVGARLILTNDYLTKVDVASMRESLEVRVPMLDEDLFAFGLRLPHRLKVHGRRGKTVLRELASRRLPPPVTRKPKSGFRIHMQDWVDSDFKNNLKDRLLRGNSRVSDLFRRDVYARWVEAFCDNTPCPGLSIDGLAQRVMMVLSLHLALEG